MKMPPSFTALMSPRREAGFSLVELLTVIALCAVMASLAFPAVSQLRARDIGASAAELGGMLENARAYAMSRNTYVWVGLLPVEEAGTSDIEKVVVMAMAAKSGREADLKSNELLPVSKPREFSQMKLQAPAAGALREEGREIAGNEDISTSDFEDSFSYRLPMLSNQIKEFTQLIQFSPTGEARIKPTASRTIEIGLHPARGNSANYAVLQINGLTGAVRTFQP